MNNKSTTPLWLVVGLVLLTLGCQTFSDLGLFTPQAPTPTPKLWPHSTFIPPQKKIQVLVGQELQIDSYHVSTAKLETIEILINDQPLRTEETAAANQTATFPGELASVQILSRGEGAQAGNLGIDVPTTSETLSLIWVAHVPGTYELSMVASDQEKRKGNRIIQLIEVK